MKFISWLRSVLMHTPPKKLVLKPSPKKTTITSIPDPTPQQRVYNAAKNSLGEHLTMNPNVPNDVGCAEAVSAVLHKAGYDLPEEGEAGVNALIAWMLKQGFIEKAAPEPGDVITAHSPDHNDPTYAHCGIVLKYGIASNTSFNELGFSAGRFQENYNLGGWNRYFKQKHKCQVRFFQPV